MHIASHLKDGLAWLLLAALPACADTTAPGVGSLTLAFCEGADWIAYQRGDGRWQTIGTSDGLYAIPATARVGIARASFADPPSGAYLHVDYLTAEQAVAKFTCNEFVSVPGKITGTVAGQLEFGWASISYGRNQWGVAWDQPAYELTPQPGSADFLAARFDSTTFGTGTDRLIIRRQRAYAPGATIPLLDFNSAEAVAPATNTVTVTASLAFVSVAYFAGGSAIGLGGTRIGTPGGAESSLSGAIASVPDAAQAAGDIHRLDVSTESRSVHLFYRGTGDRAVSFGPAASEPVFSTVAAGPWRFHVDVPRQPEYDAQVTLDVRQIRVNGTATIARLSMTREYAGAGATAWSFTLPDFQGLAGFDARATFSLEPFSYFLGASSARFGLEAANAVDGEIFRTAYTFAADVVPPASP